MTTPACPGRRLGLAAALYALLALPPTVTLAGDGSPARWLQVTGEGLANRRMRVDHGDRVAVAQLTEGADPAADGIWLPYPAPATGMEEAGSPEIAFEPPVAPSGPAPQWRLVEVPAELGPGWHLVPLPLAVWGADGLGDMESFRLTTGRDGRLSAGAARRADDPVVGCEDPPWQASGQAPPPPSLPLRVVDFESGPTEPLGNRYAPFSGRGAEVEIDRITRPDGGRSLRISARFPEGRGYGGVWFEVGPHQALRDPEAGFDLADATRVVVRGRGRLPARVGLEDVAAALREQPVALGVVEVYAGAPGDWTVELPIDGEEIDTGELRSVVIDVSDAGDGWLEVDEIWLLGAGDELPPPRRIPPAETVGPSSAGLWVWTTSSLFDASSAARQRLQALADRWGLDVVYLQLPHPSDAATAAEAGRVDRPEELASLVADLHRRGLRVHALDGAAYLALPEARGELLAIADGVAEYHRGRRPEERFDALHLDVEPYLLAADSGPRRGEIMASLAEGLGRVRSHSGVPLWIDVPFWYDSTRPRRSPERGERAGCVRPDFLGAAFEVADGVGIMAYRTSAGGIAEVALTEAGMARRAGRELVVGVETIDLPPEDGWLVEPGAVLSSLEVGAPAVIVPPGEPAPAPSYLLATTALTATGRAYLNGLGDGVRRLAITFEPGPPPSRTTFWGRPAAEIEATVSAALEELRRAGSPAAGVAYHELRSLPLDDPPGGASESGGVGDEGRRH